MAQSVFENRMNHHLSNDSFAILYRTNAQSRSLEEAFRKLNIPCRIYGGISFYQRKEIKDLLAYFRLTINLRDEDALLRVINYPARGIGKTTIEKLIATADEHKVGIVEMMDNPGTYPVDLPGGARQKVNEFITMVRSFSALLKTRPAFDTAKHIATSSGLLKELHEDKTPEGVSRFENMEELLNAIKEFGETERLPDMNTGEIDTSTRTLDEFMQDIALVTDADFSEDGNKDKVTLMTIHSAKGLEFPYVYVVGLEENLFPSIQSLSDRADLEEERRLFYVAITRARTQLTLSYAENRYKWGNLTICEPSRFLQEIPDNFIDLPKKTSVHTESFLSEDNFSASLPGMHLPQTKNHAPCTFPEGPEARRRRKSSSFRY